MVRREAGTVLSPLVTLSMETHTLPGRQSGKRTGRLLPHWPAKGGSSHRPAGWGSGWRLGSAWMPPQDHCAEGLSGGSAPEMPPCHLPRDASEDLLLRGPTSWSGTPRPCLHPSARGPVPASSYLSKSRRPHAIGLGSKARAHIRPVSPCPWMGLGRTLGTPGLLCGEHVDAGHGHQDTETIPISLKATFPDGTLPARTRAPRGGHSGDTGAGSFQLGMVPAAPLKSD